MFTYKFRLFPNHDQQTILWEHANALNRLYNSFLEQKNNLYEQEKKSLSRFDLQKQLPEIKKHDSVLARIHSQVIQQIPKRLDRSFQDFFRRMKENPGDSFGHPKFRPCHKFFGICYPQSGYSIQNNIFHTKIYGDIRFYKHREIHGTVRQVYIKCNVYNKWYITITTDYTPPQQEFTNKTIGIDIGLKDLYVTHEGKRKKNCSHAKYFDSKINPLKSRIDKLQKGSHKRRYLGKVKSRLYELKNRKLSDFQHKVSHDLVCHCDMILLENLSVKTMSESNWTNLNKAIRNARLAQFIQYLSYKGSTLKVNPFNTSKTCNNCGHIYHDLTLKERTITCKKCGITYDRDVNAAKNVYCLGQAIISNDCVLDATIQEALALRRG